MAKIEDLLREPKQGGGDPIIIYLSLFLLLLAFFILLNSISTIEEEKFQDAISSVNNAFKTFGMPSSERMFFTSDIGSFVEAASALSKIGDLVRTAIPLARVRDVKPGQLMEINLPADSIFAPGEAHLTSQSNKMLNAIGRILSRPPLDFRFDVEVLVGSEWILPEDLKKGKNLPIDRAGAFAREIRARGAPADATVVGIEIGDPEKVRILFHIRSADEQRLSFEQLVE